VFQSRAGFSSRCDRLPARRRAGRARCFNPVLGFRPAATEFRVPRADVDALFQSRAGFSSRCDSRRRSPPGTRAERSFNPVLGFRPAATLGPGGTHPASHLFQSRAGFSSRCDSRWQATSVSIRPVSIPCWVFVPLRHDGHLQGGPAVRFNPVLGFRPAATKVTAMSDDDTTRFNPVLGFRPAATRPRTWVSWRP